MSAIKINIKYTNDTKACIEMNVADATVSDIKTKIQDALNVPAAEQRLIYAGKLLKDSEACSKYNFVDGCTLHLVRSPAASARNTSSASQTNAPANQAPTQNSNQMPTQPQFPFVNASGQMPAFGGDAAAAATNIMQNPEMMRFTLEMMQNNPQLVQSLMQSNPSYRNLPPDVQNMMTNPEMIRAMLSPEVMRTMLGNAGAGEGMQFPVGFGNAQPAAGAQPSPFGMPPMPPQQPVADPATAYQSQLLQLREMGFYDESRNIEALVASRGNVNGAVEWLLAHP